MNGNDGTWTEYDLLPDGETVEPRFEDDNDLTLEDLGVVEVPRVSSRRLTAEQVSKTIEGFAQDLADDLMNDDKFQDFVAAIAEESPTLQHFKKVLEEHEQQAETLGQLDEEIVDEYEEHIAEVHSQVGTMLAQRVLTLAASKMYYPQGGRD